MNLGRIAARVASARTGATVVDIGGNVGDSAAIIRSACTAPVLCVEGDAQFLPYLEHNVRLLADVELEPSYVDAGQPGRSTVIRSGGTARLVAGEEDHGEGAISVSSIDEILERHPRFTNPALVKVDTDGQDVGILQAAADLLRKVHPVLFFEFDPELTVDRDAWEVLPLLEDLGYERALFFANTGRLLADLPKSEWSRPRLEPLIEGDTAYLDICAAATSDLDIIHAVAAAEAGASAERPDQTEMRS
jgi:FkbM family methyltransferase